MGLFSNKKKLCPICGEPTPRIFATKIEDMPICKECDKKVDLPLGMTDQMSLEDFRQYMAFYEENQRLRAAFTETARYDYRFLQDDIVVDAVHGLFRLKEREESLVFEASSLKGFQIWEDRNLLFEGGKDALRCGDSDVVERANAMQVDIDRFTRDRQEFERMEQMQRLLERDRDRDDTSYHRPYIPEPRFEMSPPVRKFRLEIELDHPYWPGLRLEWDGPEFSTTYPSVRDYLDDYQRETDELYALAYGLMQLIDPNAQEIRMSNGAFAAAGAVPYGAPYEAPQTQSQPQDDTVSEIKKYKELLDAGVITEEEFSAKKRQLLGI